MIKLINHLSEKYGKLYLTTESNTQKALKNLLINTLVNEDEFSKLHKLKEKVIILNNFKFDRWREIIINSRVVITFECGCVHVASMSDVPVVVIYDLKNKPLMISHEYSPLTKK